MMKYKEFDVVKLDNGNNATIVNIIKNKYQVAETNKDGVNIGIKIVPESNIEELIFSK